MRLKLLCMSGLIMLNTSIYSMNTKNGDSHESSPKHKNLVAYNKCPEFTEIENEHLEIVKKGEITRIKSRYFNTRESKNKLLYIFNHNVRRDIYIDTDARAVTKHKLYLSVLDNAYEEQVKAQLPLYQRYSKISIGLTAILTMISYPYLAPYLPSLEQLDKIFFWPWKK